MPLFPSCCFMNENTSLVSKPKKKTLQKFLFQFDFCVWQKSRLHYFLTDSEIVNQLEIKKLIYKNEKTKDSHFYDKPILITE